MPRNLLALSLLAATLFGAGAALEALTGIPWVRAVAAIPFVFFLPGWNTSLLLFPKEFSPLERLSFSFLTSFPAFSLFCYLPFLLFRIPVTELSVLISTGILTGASLIAGWIGMSRFGARPPTIGRIPRPLIIALALYAVLILAIFFIYPFIPEADPYTFLGLAEAVVERGEFIRPGYRPLFVTWTGGLALFSHLPLGFVFKVIIPLFGSTIFLPLFLSARQYLSDRRLLLVSVMLPITVPVILLESVVTRPQLPILFLLPPVLYFLLRAVKEKNAWLAGQIFLLTWLLYKFHEFSLLLIVPALLTFLALLYPQAKRYPKVSFACVLLTMVAIYPHFTSSTLFATTRQIAELVLSRAFQETPRLWFITHYKNVDGLEVGWPGASWVLYYAYNLGPLLPVLVGMYLLKRRRLPSIRTLWPALVTLGAFFALAEILPRFNVALYPDRSWPFFVLTFSILAPAFLRSMQNIAGNRLFNWSALTLILVGIFGALYVTHAKQGWVTRKEDKAAQFIRSHTPEGSIVISQGGNGPLISYYADRLFLGIDVFSRQIPVQEAHQRIKDAPAISGNKPGLEQEKQTLIGALTSQTANLSALGTEQLTSARPTILTQLDRLLVVEQALERIERLGVAGPRPVYILYSHDKFSYLYGRRAWWRALNFAEADLDRFANTELYEQVFGNGAVAVWRYKGG